MTFEEFRRIVEAEGNSERRLFYELLGKTGMAQPDACMLSTTNVDRTVGIKGIASIASDINGRSEQSKPDTLSNWRKSVVFQEDQS